MLVLPTDRFKPSTTVAALIEHKGQFLLVEERTPEGLRLNNPAGHLDAGESLLQACIREVLEETACVFTPSHLLGIYMSRFTRPALRDSPAEDITYLRFAFCGSVGEAIAGQALDEPIERTLWMSPDEIRACPERHRSPLLLKCMEDYLSGKRYPLELLTTDSSVFSPIQSLSK